MKRTVFLLLTLVAWGSFLLCPTLFLTASFAPRLLGFLDSAVCPDGGQIGRLVSSQSDLRGNVTSVNWVCNTAGGEAVDITWKVLLILFTLPAIGIAALLLRPIKENPPGANVPRIVIHE